MHSLYLSFCFKFIVGYQRKIKTVAVYEGLSNEFKMVDEIHWPNRDNAPPDKPECGFNNELCDNSK